MCVCVCLCCHIAIDLQLKAWHFSLEVLGPSMCPPDSTARYPMVSASVTDPTCYGQVLLRAIWSKLWPHSMSSMSH